MSEPTTGETNVAPFIDTPLLAAKRKAFDNPTQSNLDALIAIAKNTIDEWTEDTVHRLFRRHWQSSEAFKLIADAHNAAVKEAYEKGKQDGIREHYVGK